MNRFAIGLLVTLVSLPAQAQECSQILSHGIYDIQSSANDLATSASFSQWFCDKKFSSAQQANDFGASLAFPFEGLPVKLGINSSSSSWSESYSSFCGRVQKDQSLQSRVREHVKTVNPQIVQAFNSCIESDGLHVWLELTYDPKRFRFAARFNPPNSQNPKATIQRFDPGPNVSCRDAPTTIDRPIWRTNCTRKNDDPVSIVVNANFNPRGGNLDLPAIAHYAPTIQPAFEITDKQPYNYKFTFIATKDGDKIWISITNPCGGILDGRNYGFYLSKNQTEIQIPIPQGCTIYAFGKIRLFENRDLQEMYIYFDGGFHTTDGTEKVFTDIAVGRILGLFK
jgi:hypothetical protein